MKSWRRRTAGGHDQNGKAGNGALKWFHYTHRSIGLQRSEGLTTTIDNQFRLLAPHSTHLQRG